MRVGCCDANHVLACGHDGREEEEQQHGRAADAQERQTRAEADGSEERDHQRQLQRGREREWCPAVRAADRHESGHEKSPDDRRRDVVGHEERQEPPDAVPHEQNEAGESHGLDLIQCQHRGTLSHSRRSRAACEKLAPEAHLHIDTTTIRYNQGVLALLTLIVAVGTSSDSLTISTRSRAVAPGEIVIVTITSPVAISAPIVRAFDRPTVPSYRLFTSRVRRRRKALFARYLRAISPLYSS